MPIITPTPRIRDYISAIEIGSTDKQVLAEKWTLKENSLAKDGSN